MAIRAKQYLATHGKANDRYNTLGADQQKEYRTQFNQQGQGAAKNYLQTQVQQGQQPQPNPQNPAQPSPGAPGQNPSQVQAGNTFKPVQDFQSTQNNFKSTSQFAPQAASGQVGSVQSYMQPGAANGPNGAATYAPGSVQGANAAQSYIQPGGPQYQNTQNPGNYQRTSEFMPQNAADVQASPGFQWREQQALKAAEQRRAAQGFTGSGKAVSDDVGISQKLTGEEYDRMTELGKFDAGRSDTDLNRRTELNKFDSTRSDTERAGLRDMGKFDATQDQVTANRMADLGKFDATMANNQADRMATLGQFDASMANQGIDRAVQQGNFDATRYDANQAANNAMAGMNANRYDAAQAAHVAQGNNQQQFQWNSMMDLMNRNDSMNPMNYAMQGTGGYADANIGMGKATAPYTQNMYMPNFGGGGGGGGYIPMPTYVPPMPSGPDTTASDIINSYGY